MKQQIIHAGSGRDYDWSNDHIEEDTASIVYQHMELGILLFESRSKLVYRPLRGQVGDDGFRRLTKRDRIFLDHEAYRERSL